MSHITRPSLRTLIRLLAALPVLASFSIAGSAIRVGPSVAGCAQASTPHHAALVLEHADGTVVSACVSFSEGSITGDELLARSQVQYATADYGGTGKAVCQLDHEPAQYPPSCWTASSRYWAMYVSHGGGSWSFSSLGISSQTFADGDAEGFRYEGQNDYSAPPSAAGVCPPPATQTPSPAVTAPVTSTATATRRAGARGVTPGGGSAAGSTATQAPAGAAATDPAVLAPAPVVALAAPSPAPPASRAGSGWSGGGAWIVASSAAVLLLLLLAFQLARSRAQR